MHTVRANSSEKLAAVEREFVELWGTMSSLWGVNATMARLHGALFITGRAMTADNLLHMLGISRGSVSMNLAKLLEWGLVKRAHRPGERREYYEAHGDVWEMFTAIATHRKRREIDPLLNTLRRCKEELSPESLGSSADAADVRERARRINDMVKFLTLMDSLSQRFFESHKSLRAAVELLSGEG
jgi:DNA-binding transcriptional regulator GbsR (MarR family)